MDMIKYPKIKTLGADENKDIFENDDDIIFVESKMDGGNMRCLITDGRLIFGSHHCQITSDLGEYTNVNKAFKRSVNYLREKITPITPEIEGNILFGENMVPHSLEYNWDIIPKFIAYDIWNIKEGKFHSYFEVENFCIYYGLTMAPLVGIFKAKELRERIDTIHELIPVSQWHPKDTPTQQDEGIVIKNYRNGIFAKIVGDKFKEKNRECFGSSPKHASDSSIKIGMQYCTNARIEKMIFKLIDEGMVLDMKMMVHLPKHVYSDMIDEEYRDILYLNEAFNPKEIRSHVAKRCQAVLKQIIMTNKITGER